LSRPRLKMQQDIGTVKQISCLGMIALCPRQAWWSWVHALWEPSVNRASPRKIARQKRAIWSITQPWINQFRSNFVQCLNTWYAKCYKSSSSRGQRSRSQRDITYWHQNAIIQALISCRMSNLVKIISELSATRYTAFEVIRSNTEIAITPPRIARRLCSNVIQSFIMLRRYAANVQGQRSRL